MNNNNNSAKSIRLESNLFMVLKINACKYIKQGGGGGDSETCVVRSFVTDFSSLVKCKMWIMNSACYLSDR